MVGGLAAAAAVRTFPFRVFSFPTQLLVRHAPIIDPMMVNGLLSFRGREGDPFIEMARLTRLEICAVFRVPPQRIGLYESGQWFPIAPG